jgi:hypothetical protein
MTKIIFQVHKFANSGKTVVEYSTHNHNTKGSNHTLVPAAREWLKMKTIRFQVQKLANSGKTEVEYSTHNHKIKGLNSALPQQRERMVKNENNKISSSEVGQWL